MIYSSVPAGTDLLGGNAHRDRGAGLVSAGFAVAAEAGDAKALVAAARPKHAQQLLPMLRSTNSHVRIAARKATTVAVMPTSMSPRLRLGRGRMDRGCWSACLHL